MVLFGACGLASIKYLFIITRWLLEHIYWIPLLFIIGGLLSRTKIISTIAHAILTIVAGSVAVFSTGIAAISGIGTSLLMPFFKIAYHGAELITLIISIFIPGFTVAYFGIAIAPFLAAISFFTIMDIKQLSPVVKFPTAFVAGLTTPLFLIQPNFVWIYLLINLYTSLFASKKSEFIALTVPVIYIAIIILILTRIDLGYCNLIQQLASTLSPTTPFKLPQI